MEAREAFVRLLAGIEARDRISLLGTLNRWSRSLPRLPHANYHCEEDSA
jgi:hypothetical protein